MSQITVYQQIFDKSVSRKKQLAVLVDPDKANPEQISQLVTLANRYGIDYFFVGGSLLTTDHLTRTVVQLKAQTQVPVVLFPGSINQISPIADALLLLSLISGRNADLLIGAHVQAAPALKAAQLETIATGYMVIDSGKPTTVSYMSNTWPIPNDKPEIAACTAMAGEMLGLKTIYLDAGSGAQHTVNPQLVAAVRGAVTIPIIVGGGIKTIEQAQTLYNAGADVLVVGNILEKSPDLLAEFAQVAYALS